MFITFLNIITSKPREVRIKDVNKSAFMISCNLIPTYGVVENTRDKKCLN